MQDLKAVSAKFLLVCFLCVKESTFETKKNVFCFTSKALFVLEIPYTKILTRHKINNHVIKTKEINANAYGNLLKRV